MSRGCLDLRAGYRSLLEGGVRVFEWKARCHAKSAVADGRWARVGSTNNQSRELDRQYELDVAIETPTSRTGVETITSRPRKRDEIVLDIRKRLRPRATGKRRRAHRGTGSASRAAAGALRLSHTVGAAITNRRHSRAHRSGGQAAVGVV